MDIKSLDKALIEIVEKKNALSLLSYNSPDYDKLEEELHDLEDDFLEEYGQYLEEAFHLVHDEFCSDNEVLLPIAYLANRYLHTGFKEDGSKEYIVEPQQGVVVDVDDYPNQINRLVLIPNPTRILLTIGNTKLEEVWRAVES